MSMTGRFIKDILFYAATLFLVMVSVLCFAGTVISQSHIGRQEMENYYRVKEQELEKEIWGFLNEEGYENSGVAITRVVDEEGCREYTVTIHHSRIDRMDEEEKEALKKELTEFAFAAEGCTFSYKFLSYD